MTHYAQVLDSHTIARSLDHLNPAAVIGVMSAREW